MNYKYILISLIIVGCSSPTKEETCEANTFLEVTAPSLTLDENNIYHIEFLDGYTQTFSTLDGNTGVGNFHKVYWGSDKGIIYGGETVSCVNSASYTDENGMSHTVFSAWEILVGDTITVYAGYANDCNVEVKDSIKIVIENFNE